MQDEQLATRLLTVWCKRRGERLIKKIGNNALASVDLAAKVNQKGTARMQVPRQEISSQKLG